MESRLEEEFNFKDLYQVIKKHIFTMITAVLLGTVLSVTIMIFFITPKYSSDAQLLVNQQGDTTQTTIQNNEIQANVQLINTYRDIITGHSVLSQLNENIEENYSIRELQDSINVSQSPNSQAFNITVKMESPEEAQSILNGVINVFESTIQEVYPNNAASIFILSPATYNPNKVSPSLILFILIGAFLGLLVSILVVIVIELMDTTIKEDDFLSQLGMINLGRIYELSGKELKQSRLNGMNPQKRDRERI